MAVACRINNRWTAPMVWPRSPTGSSPKMRTVKGSTRMTKRKSEHNKGIKWGRSLRTTKQVSCAGTVNMLVSHFPSAINLAG